MYGLMRDKADSIEQINKHLNDQGFYREIKYSGRKTYMIKQKLSDRFKDNFYYGMLKQVKHSVDLREIYEEDFIII